MLSKTFVLKEAIFYRVSQEFEKCLDLIPQNSALSPNNMNFSESILRKLVVIEDSFVVYNITQTVPKIEQGFTNYIGIWKGIVNGRCIYCSDRKITSNSNFCAYY